MNQNTSTFIKKLANYYTSNLQRTRHFVQSGSELEDPNILMRAELPNRINIMTEMGITQLQAPEGETADQLEERLRQNRLLTEPAETLYVQEMGQFAKKRSLLKANMAKLWGIIIGQCTKALAESIRAEHDWRGADWL